MTSKFAAIAASAVTITVLANLPAGAADPPGVSLELNKLEPDEKGCRTSLVLNNTTDHTYQSFAPEIYLFQADGVIAKRLTINLAPIKPQKKTVKIFTLDGVACDKIGSLLINDIVECKNEAGPQPDCLDHLTTSSLANVKISK